MSGTRNVKVGAFVLTGLVVLAVVIFLIGDERRMFQSKVEYRIVFHNVEGLKRGSPVRMGGVDVGDVSHVGYSDNPKDARLYVTVSMVDDEAQRIRADSVASIASKGLLGDKMIVVTVGSPGKPRIKPGGIIPSTESSDIADMLSQVSTIGKRAEEVMNNLQKTTDTLADRKFNNDVKRSAHSLGNILESMDTGDGYAARLLHDPKEADHLSRTVANLEHTTAELNHTVNGFNQIIGRVQKGPGFAHEVIYGKSGSKALGQFGDAAEEVAVTLRGIRKGNGVAKSLIYGDDKSQQLMGNLNAMSGDLRHIVADARAGKGTVGALLVDPSVYEDIKMLLGNVQRNEVLRALVRYSIKRDEKEGPKVQVTDPDSPAGGGASSAGGSASGDSSSTGDNSSSSGGGSVSGGGAAPAPAHSGSAP